MLVRNLDETATRWGFCRLQRANAAMWRANSDQEFRVGSFRCGARRASDAMIAFVDNYHDPFAVELICRR